jgi:hypothetical protein
MNCSLTCTYQRVVVDYHSYTDLIAGLYMAKQRSRCTVGHSTWDTITLGPILEEPREVFVLERQHHESATAPRPCGSCQKIMEAPRDNQVYCSIVCRRRHNRTGLKSKRLTRDLDPAWMFRFAEMWNDGTSPQIIGTRMQLKPRSVAAYANLLRKRGYELVRRPHGGARIARATPAA